MGFVDGLLRNAAHVLHQVGRYAKADIARAHHHHLGNRCRQRHHHLERGATPLLRCGDDMATQRLYLRAHDVHTDAASRNIRNGCCRGEARRKNQLCRLLHIDSIVQGDEARLHCLLADALQLQTGTVVLKGHCNVVTFLLHLDRNRACHRFVLALALIRSLNTVGHAVSQQVLERRGHPVQHTAVNLNRTTHDVQLDLLAQLFRDLTHDGVQTLGDRIELHHACTQQIALQLSRLAALGNQIILGAFGGALQITLHGTHVIDRLRHHASQFLHAGKTVKLQRVKARI